MLMILAQLVRSESFWAVVKVRCPHTGPGISYIIEFESPLLNADGAEAAEGPAAPLPAEAGAPIAPATAASEPPPRPAPAPEASFTHDGHFDFPPLRSPLHVHSCPKSRLGSTALTIMGHGPSATTQPPSGPATHLSPPTLLGQCNGHGFLCLQNVFHHGMQQLGLPLGKTSLSPCVMGLRQCPCVMGPEGWPVYRLPVDWGRLG